MLLLKRIYKLSLFILIPAALISAIIEWKLLPVSILIGGTLGLANLKGLVRGVEGLVKMQKTSGVLIFSSFVRLMIIGFILSVLIIEKMINIVGVLAGFTIVFTVVLIEGLRAAREM
jgi:hypothetical protein